MAAGSGDDDAPRPNPLPSSLVSNLQSVLAARRHPPAEGSDPAAADAEAEPPAEAAPAKPAVIVTCSGGIQSLGLAALVDALAAGGSCDFHVCAPDSDKSSCGHSVTVHETVAATLVEFARAKAFEVSGTPVDCVSLALSGRLFPWSAPALVISSINAGSNCGHETFYSSAIAAAREALMCGVPSIAISLNWKKDESKDSDFKDAADVCLPFIHVALTDIEKGTFLKGCLLNIGIPSSPTSNKERAQWGCRCRARPWCYSSRPTATQILSPTATNECSCVYLKLEDNCRLGPVNIDNENFRIKGMKSVESPVMVIPTMVLRTSGEPLHEFPMYERCTGFLMLK